MIDVKNMEEAIEWAMRMPDPHGFGEGQIEIRQVFDAAELIHDPEALAKEVELRVKVMRNKNA